MYLIALCSLLKKEALYGCWLDKREGLKVAQRNLMGIRKSKYIPLCYDENVIDYLERTITQNPVDAIYGRTMMMFYEDKGIYKKNDKHCYVEGLI